MTLPFYKKLRRLIDRESQTFVSPEAKLRAKRGADWAREVLYGIPSEGFKNTPKTACPQCGLRLLPKDDGCTRCGWRLIKYVKE